MASNGGAKQTESVEPSPERGEPSPESAGRRGERAPRAVRALKGVNAEQPAVIQSAYAGLMKPAQEALQKALAAA